MLQKVQSTTLTRIGRFNIRKVLGKGAQGIVYLAEDPDLHRPVAIKTLKGRDTSPEELQNEARLVSQLRHPNIVPVFEMGEHAETPYVVYQYVEGRSLKRLLQEEENLSVHRALNWTRQILEALECAHAQGVIHLDLNPANIHIGNDDTAQVMDFGIASLNGIRTSPGSGIQGTANYLAPELLDNGVVTAAADLFSLGLVMYEMLSGAPAIESGDEMAAIYRIAHEEIPLLRERRPDIDQKLEEIVLQALDKDPEDRFASAKEMGAALTAYMEESPEMADKRQLSTINFLLRRMRKKSDFPAISRHIADICQKSMALDGNGANDLANTILKDYALTTKLLKLVNASYYGQYGGHISTISRAVVILGFKQVRTAALSLLLYEHISDGKQAKELKETAGRAFFSAVIARRLAGDIAGPDPEEAFVCAMFHTLGEHLTVYYFPEEHEEILKEIANKGVDEATACRSMLGLTYEELALGIAREWQLPEEIQESMRALPEGPVQKACTPFEVLKQLSVLSNQMAEAAASASPGERDGAMQAVLDRFQESIPISKGEINGIMKQALADVQSFAAILNIDFRSSRFFQNASDWLRGESKEKAPDTAHPDTLPNRLRAVPAEVPEHPQAVLLSGIQDITQALLENYRLNDILIMILETIYRGMGFTHVLLSIRDIKNRTMVARFALGRDTDAILPKFRFSIENRQDLFNRAVNRKEDNVHKIRSPGDALLPAWYRDLIHPSSLAIYPIVINNVCLGLIYADREEPDRPFTNDDLNYINTLRNQAALAIKQRS